MPGSPRQPAHARQPMHSPTRLAYLLAYHCGALRSRLTPSPFPLLPPIFHFRALFYVHLYPFRSVLPSFLPRTGIVSTRCRPGRPRDPSFTGRLSPTSPLPGGPSGLSGLSAATEWRGLRPGWRGSFCSLPGGAVGACAAIMGFALSLAVPGGGTGPGASRPRRAPSAVRGGQVWDWSLAGFR